VTRSLFSFISGLLLVGLSASVAFAQATTATAPIGEKPTVTVIAVGPDEVYADLRVIIAEIAKAPKEFDTLKETIDVFLFGVDTSKPVAFRSYLAGEDLRHVGTLPVKGDAGLREFLTNLWDLGVKSVPPPEPAYRSQIPSKINTKYRTLRLTSSERLLFDLTDGFLRYESGIVHLGEQLGDVRAVKGVPSTDLLKTFKIAAIWDGTAALAAGRRKALQSRRKEFMENFQPSEGEDPADFAIRKIAIEHQFDELERFFAESSNITAGWAMSTKEKHGTFDLAMKALADTSLADSIDQLAKTPDQFASIDKKDSVGFGRINFPIDDLRKTALLNSTKLWRERTKQKIDADAKLDAEKKTIDKDLADLSFDIVNDIANSGIFNGFIRVRRDASGNYVTVGVAAIPDGGKVVQMVQKMAAREGAENVALKVDSEGDIEIHKLKFPEHQKDYADVLGADGTVYVGTAPNAVWYAAGTGALDVLKAAIKESTAGGPKTDATVLELVVTGGVGIEFLEKHFPKTDEPAPAGSKTATKSSGSSKSTAKSTAKSADSKDEKAAERLERIRGLGLRQVALDAFKEGNDTITVRLSREENTVKLNVRFDEGILRFVGKAVAKGVRENLGD
jgi:hypothetical protein